MTARCTVARLMRQMGLAGVVRGRTVRTTISDPGQAVVVVPVGPLQGGVLDRLGPCPASAGPFLARGVAPWPSIGGRCSSIVKRVSLPMTLMPQTRWLIPLPWIEHSRLLRASRRNQN